LVISATIYIFADGNKKDMSNKDRASKWLEIVNEDLSVAEDLYKTGHWLYVAFMCHQVIEKTLKSYWCVCRDDDPPFIHDHKRLAEGCGLYTKMDDGQKDFLTTIRQMNIEARYQEYKDEVATALNKEKAAEILEYTKQMHSWILQKYSEKTKH
jgi:HEPN domain-containing protein